MSSLESSRAWVHLRTCPNRVIDPVNAARFMTAASTLQRLARSAALNASCAARPSRIGIPPGCLDIASSPVRLWQESWLESFQHGRIFVRCPSSDQLSWRGKIPVLAGRLIFYGPTAKRKWSRVSLPSMTQSSGLLSTRRRTSQLPAIARDRANDERAGPRPLGGQPARLLSLQELDSTHKWSLQPKST